MTTSFDADIERGRVLPACQRCRTRKIKCDRRAPKCSRCAKAKATCLVVDPVTSETYSRDFISQLEDKEKELRAAIEASATPTLTEGGIHDGHPDSLTSPASISRANAFVGDGSGLGLMRSIFSDQRWQSYEPQLLEQLAERPQIPELEVNQNHQPPIEEASKLLENYFGRFHINHTFLLRRDIMATFDRVYHSSGIPASSQDHFRLFMVFAISGVTRYRASKCSEHPYGYYLAAQNYLTSTPLVGSLDAIQNLLLVARFGMYHHIGMSLWDISRFCMRQCIEQGLHLSAPSGDSLLQQQHKRRIFWECYILDRYSSGVLGRPFAILNEDIKVGLPVNASDEMIETEHQPNTLGEIETEHQANTLGEIETEHQVNTLDDIMETSPSAEMSVFIFVIELRRITSRIHTDFYDIRDLGASASGGSTPHQRLSTGDVYVKLYQIMSELDGWRQRAPVFPEQRSLYEKPEWYDFMLVKDKLLLVRAAMHLAPRRNGHPPGDLLQLSLKYAIEIVYLYDTMFQSKSITWTRSYFQVIFTAGLSIIHCVSLGVHSDADAPAPAPSATLSPTSALETCSRILQMFKKEMPDAGRFAIVFEMLKGNITRDLNGGQTTTLHSQRDSIDSHIEQATISSLDRLQEHYTFEKPSNGIDLLADVASWPGGMGTLTSMNQQASSTLLPQNNFYGSLSEINQANIGGDSVLEWPALTDEMMEQLETGLGEYAWDTIGNASYSWDPMGWGP